MGRSKLLHKTDEDGASMLRAFGLVDLDEAKWDTLFTELLSKIGNAIPNKILNTPPRNSMKFIDPIPFAFPTATTPNRPTRRP